MVTITPLPDLTIPTSHLGNCTQGQQGAQFSLVVTNGGSVSDAGTITVTDTFPAGQNFVSGTGTGWSCGANGQVVTCTDSATPITGSGGTSTITLNVNVAGNASGTLSNTATVACTCTESNTNNNTSNTDMVTVGQFPDLTIAKSHMGNLTAGQQGAQFTLAVTNGGSAASSGASNVTDKQPTGLTFDSGNATGWA